MYLELVDALRCLRPHEPAALVASVDRMVGREVLSGTLGCPVCDARYPIAAGALLFDGSAVPDQARADAAARAEAAPASESIDQGIRVAALLDLESEEGLVLLHGSWGSIAGVVSRLVPAPMVLLNPAATVQAGGRLTVIRAPVAPLVSGALVAAALDTRAEAALAASVVDAVRPGGRVMGPAGLPLPDGVRELARDAEGWVGTIERPAAVGPPIPLRRR